MGSYANVTDNILKMLDSGIVPWRKPWVSTFPVNATTMRDYSGFNTLWLAIRDFGSPYWAGLRQWNKRGCKVKKGERGTSIFIPIFCKTKDADGKETTRLVRFSTATVFNAEQVTGKNIPVVEKRDHSPIEAAEKIVAGMPNAPEMFTDTVSAFYRPATDSVHVPALDQFKSAEAYHSVVFHELGHSTGHTSRLDRKGISDVNKGSDVYAHEELIAEFAAAMLCGVAGIAPAVIENAAAYIAHWRKRLADGKVSILAAASAAQKAANFVLGKVKPA